MEMSGGMTEMGKWRVRAIAGERWTMTEAVPDDGFSGRVIKPDHTANIRKKRREYAAL